MGDACEPAVFILGGKMELEFIFCSLFFLCCVFHCYTDYKEMLLYDEVTMSLLTVGIVRAFAEQGLLNGLLGAGITGGAFLLLYYLSKGGMGFGDVKLALALGVWLGWERGLMSLLVALWLGFLFGVILLIVGKKKRTDAIAFGPYMCVAGFMMLLKGDIILSWYKSLFY